MSQPYLPQSNALTSFGAAADFFNPGDPRNGAARVIVTKVVLRETGTYNHMYGRTYMTEAPAYELKALGERMAQNSSTHFTPGRVAGGLGSLLQLETAPMSNDILGIEGGWQDKRLTFVIYVDVEMTAGGKQAYVIQGYTNYSGVNTFSKTVDPDMVLYINNVIHIREDQKRTPFGWEPYANITANYHLISNANQPMSPATQSMQGVRPQDVYSIVSLNQVADYATKSIYSSANSLTSKPMGSQRSNNAPASYAAKIFNGFATASQSVLQGDDMRDMLSQAVDASRDPLPIDNHFLRALTQVTAAGSLTSAFRWRDLAKLDDNLANVLNLIVQAPTQQAQQHSAGMTESWKSATLETKYAATLSNAFPSIMMDCMLSSLAVTFTNMNGTMMTGSQFTWMPQYFTGFANTDLTNFVQRCMQRIEVEVMNDLSFNNSQSYDIMVNCNIFGETLVRVSVNGSAPYDYVTPSFCDGLFSPVISPTKERAYHTASDMRDMATAAFENIGGSMPVPSVDFTNINEQPLV